MIKKEIRILGIDDGAFLPRTKQPVPVIGVIFRGGDFIDGALRTEVDADGTDATSKIVKLINDSRHKQQLKVIMLDGITLAGFNVVDIKKLNEQTKIPVIAINRKIPNIQKVKDALKKLPNFEERLEAVENAGEIKNCYVKDFKRVYYQCMGINDDTTREIIKLSSTRSDIPEPLRVAHLLATALVRGESYGRA